MRVAGFGMALYPKVDRLTAARTTTLAQQFTGNLNTGARFAVYHIEETDRVIIPKISSISCLNTLSVDSHTTVNPYYLW